MGPTAGLGVLEKKRISSPCRDSNPRSSSPYPNHSTSYAVPSPHIFRVKEEVKLSRYRPGVAQRVGRGIALLFHDRGTRRGWVVSSTPWPHFTPGKDPVPILQEAGWAPGQVWTDGKSRPHRDPIPDRPACSQSLTELSQSTIFSQYLIKTVK